MKSVACNKSPITNIIDTERIRLLVHILCELRESHNITSEKLKDAGQDVRRGIVPEERLQVLDEIYYVRDMEELYLDGKIGMHPWAQPNSRARAEANLHFALQMVTL